MKETDVQEGFALIITEASVLFVVLILKRHMDQSVKIKFIYTISYPYPRYRKNTKLTLYEIYGLYAPIVILLFTARESLSPSKR